MQTNLETFLVEWKRLRHIDGNYRPLHLETFLVEWKLDPDHWKVAELRTLKPS